MAVSGTFWVSKVDREWISEQLEGQVTSEQVDKVCQAIADRFAIQPTDLSIWPREGEYKRLKAQKKAEKKARKAAKKQAKHEALFRLAEIPVSVPLTAPGKSEAPAHREQVSEQDIRSFLLGKGAQLALNEAWGGKGLVKHGEAFLVKWMNKWYQEGLNDWLGPLLDIPEQQLGLALGRLYQPRYHQYRIEDYAQVVQALKNEEVTLGQGAEQLLMDFQAAVDLIEEPYRELFQKGMLAGLKLKARVL